MLRVPVDRVFRFLSGLIRTIHPYNLSKVSHSDDTLTSRGYRIIPVSQVFTHIILIINKFTVYSKDEMIKNVYVITGSVVPSLKLSLRL